MGSESGTDNRAYRRFVDKLSINGLLDTMLKLHAGNADFRSLVRGACKKGGSLLEEVADVINPFPVDFPVG